MSDWHCVVLELITLIAGYFIGKFRVRTAILLYIDSILPTTKTVSEVDLLQQIERKL